MIRDYHHSYDMIDSIPEEKDYLKECYQTIVNHTAYFISTHGFNNAVSANVAFEYLLWNGYLSHNHDFVFDQNSEKYNYKDMYGLEAILGRGGCISIAGLQKDVFTKLGYDSHLITCRINEEPDVIYRPFIKRSFNSDVKTDKRDTKIGNHVVTYVDDNDVYYVFDPTYLETFYLNSNFKINNYFGEYEKKVEVIPESMLFLERMKTKDFYSILEKLHSEDYSDVRSKMGNYICNESEKTLKKLEGMREELIDFYYNIMDDVNLIYDSFDPKENILVKTK
jgi:hypothetical protein